MADLGGGGDGTGATGAQPQVTAAYQLILPMRVLSFLGFHGQLQLCFSVCKLAGLHLRTDSRLPEHALIGLKLLHFSELFQTHVSLVPPTLLQGTGTAALLMMKMSKGRC